MRTNCETKVLWILILLTSFTAWAYPPAPAPQSSADAHTEKYLYMTPWTTYNVPWLVQTNSVLSTNGATVGQVPTYMGGSTGVQWATPSGGLSGGTVSNLWITSTNPVLVDLTQAEIWKLILSTNASLVFTNFSTNLVRGLVYLKQDTNGQHTASFSVAGGLLETNAPMNVTTNPLALDLLEVASGYESTNLAAWWPQDLKPRVVVTNSLPVVASCSPIMNQSTNNDFWTLSANVSSQFFTNTTAPITICEIDCIVTPSTTGSIYLRLGDGIGVSPTTTYGFSQTNSAVTAGLKTVTFTFSPPITIASSKNLYITMQCTDGGLKWMADTQAGTGTGWGGLTYYAYAGSTAHTDSDFCFSVYTQ